MSTTIYHQNTCAGPVAILDVIQFAELLYKRYERAIEDIITANAIDQVVLGVKKKNKKKKKDPVIEFTVLEYDIQFGGATLDISGEDSGYKRVQVSLEAIDPNDDIVTNMAKQIISRSVPHQMHGKPESKEEAYEIAAVEALENFATPTHVIHVKPNLVIAVDIEDFKVAMIDDSGIIRMAVYTERVSAWRALEIPQMS